MELNLEASLIRETLVLNRSLDPSYGDYIKLNDLNVPLELRRGQVDDLMPTIEEGEVIDEPMIDIIKTRNNESFDEYPSFCDFNRKIHIDCAYNLRFSCMIKKSKLKKGSSVSENMDGYRDKDMGDIILRTVLQSFMCGSKKCMTRSSTKELLTPFKDLEREFRSSRKLFKTLSLDESRSPEYNLFSYLEENSKEEVTETMAETMEQYMSKTRADYGSGIARTKIDDKDHFVLKGQFLKELRDNTFSGLDHEDANEHIEKVQEIIALFNVPNITQDQVMLQVFPMSLTGAASHWLRNKPSGSIKTWEYLKIKFLSKYCPPVQTAKKMEEINNFHQEPDETLYQAWERFKELLKKFPQHYLTEMKENGTPRTRSIETSDGLAAIQAQLNNLGREMKKVNEKVYAAQVECEKCK
ncbi:putative reverse transcriptase domain-containing protein [Tanacetum coccineum]|uniref:Reverse transcriptase domain-containing protein n=1 Tax=Tanacetum coccineum TaxID=301880 RepID=A0ABQ5CJI4_9ASTR